MQLIEHLDHVKAELPKSDGLDFIQRHENRKTKRVSYESDDLSLDRQRNNTLSDDSSN